MEKGALAAKAQVGNQNLIFIQIFEKCENVNQDEVTQISDFCEHRDKASGFLKVRSFFTEYLSILEIIHAAS